MSFSLPALPPRLTAVLQLVPEGSVVADVGAGHGLLSLHLVASGRASRVVAIDRSDSEIEAALRFPDADPRALRLVLRQGDGLAALTPEDRVDTVVIAGVGGGAAAAMLAAAPAAVLPVRVVVQAQTEVGALRRALLRSGLGLADERLVSDRGRFYAVIAAERGRATALPEVSGLTRDDVLEAGPVLLRDRPAAMLRYWTLHAARLARIAARGAPGGDESLARAARIIEFLHRPAPSGVCFPRPGGNRCSE